MAAAVSTLTQDLDESVAVFTEYPYEFAYDLSFANKETAEAGDSA
jgi:hypothetical protein